VKGAIIMPSVSFKDFKEFSSHWTKVANDNDDEEWEEEVIDSANTLHEVYCWNDECRWDEEEGFLHDPWLGPSHAKWIRIWEAFHASGITLEGALNAVEAVTALSKKRD
jgi:hypothetical protein